jgi:hypothetical protein
LFYAILGALVLIDLRLTDFPSTATTDFFGPTQTQLWGTIDLGVGALLIIGAATWGRGLTTVLAAALVVGGVVVVAALDQLPDRLRTESAYGWLAIVVGVVLLVVAMVVPSVAGTRRRVTNVA